MATFRRGLDAEDRVCTKLEGFGCTIQRDPVLDHKHKLDFVITRYNENPNFYAFGVQITTKLDQIEKQEEFLKANQSNGVTNKALYLELSDKLDLDYGGAMAVLSVIMDFQFNRSFTNVRISAARIFDDFTFQFYDLSARVKQLRGKLEEQQFRHEVERVSVMTPRDRVGPASAASAPAVPTILQPRGAETLQGTIESYVRQGGHGVVSTEGDTKYFFHISHVADEALREQLNALPYSTMPARLYVSVDFFDAGFTKPGARYPEARGVRARA